MHRFSYLSEVGAKGLLNFFDFFFFFGGGGGGGDGKHSNHQDWEN